MFPADYNPMMESPPNANALEVPRHQILNLSQPQIVPNSLGLRTSAPSSHPTAAPSSNFPPDIATILNEPSDNQFRPSLRDYQNSGELTGPRPTGDHMQRPPAVTAVTAGPAPPPAGDNETLHVDDGHIDQADKKENIGEDNRFMTRTYNLLTASQDDLGEMMDEYSIYPE